MAVENEIKELQLGLESKVCGLAKDGLKELAEHLQVGAKELGRLALSRKICEKIELDLSETDDKKTLLVVLLAFVDETVADKPTKVKVKPPNPSEKATEKAQGAETKVNVDVSKVLRRDFKIHGVVAGDNFKDGLSFVSLARQIESGIKAGYKESEINEAVISAVSPSLTLRSYLEMIPGFVQKIVTIFPGLFKDYSRTKLNFQGPPTREVI